jgi:dynein heavy chain 1
MDCELARVHLGMSVKWDFFVNAIDTHRYLPAAGLEGRENRNLAYVREFAAVVSILQVS